MTGTAAPSLRSFVTRRFAGHGPPASWVLFEPLGGALAYVFARLGFISPSAVTLLGFAAGVAGSAALATAQDVEGVVLAAVLLLLAYTLDCADGQLARATGRTSAQGAWLDVAVDAAVTAMLTASLSYALTTDGGPGLWNVVLAGAFGASRTASLFTWTQVRATKEATPPSTGLRKAVTTAYAIAVDTPVVYAVLCLARLSPTALRWVIAVLVVLTLGRMVRTARRHFGASASSRPAPSTAQ